MSEGFQKIPNIDPHKMAIAFRRAGISIHTIERDAGISKDQFHRLISDKSVRPTHKIIAGLFNLSCDRMTTEEQEAFIESE